MASVAKLKKMALKRSPSREQASSLANKLATPSPSRPHIPFLGAAGTPAPSMASDDAIPLDDALSDARRAIDLFLDGETEESRKIVEPL